MVVRERAGGIGAPIAIALLAGVMCGAPTTSPPANRGAAIAPDLEIAYRTWGLMPPPRCGTPTYEIVVARDRAVSCGWSSQCPPYSAATPLRPIVRGRLSAEQVGELAAVASADAFFALKEFDANIHIIDGGEEQLDVRVGERRKRVELANTSAPPFTAVRDALERATDCSIATAGPMPP